MAEKENNPYLSIVENPSQVSSSNNIQSGAPTPVAEEKPANPYMELIPQDYATKTPNSSVTVTGAPLDYASQLGGGVAGAATGYALDKLGIGTEEKIPNTSRQFKTATARANVLNESADRMLDNLIDAKQSHAESIDKAFNEHLNAQRELQQAAEEKLAAELEHAKVMPSGSIGKEVSPESSGARWQTKVAGDLSPAGQSSTESARLYNQAKEIPASVAEKYNLTNLTNRQGQGLLVPHSVDVNYLTPAQQSAKDALEASHAKHAEAIENAAKAQYELEKLRNSLPKPIAMAENAFNRIKEQASRASQLAEQYAPETYNVAEKAGRVIGKVPRYAFGALSGLQGARGMQEINKGNVGEGVIDLMSGAGGALMMYPHPYAKVAGALLQAPDLAYTGYKMLKD
jgi:hypothetical protein